MQLHSFQKNKKLCPKNKNLQSFYRFYFLVSGITFARKRQVHPKEIVKKSKKFKLLWPYLWLLGFDTLKEFDGTKLFIGDGHDANVTILG